MKLPYRNAILFILLFVSFMLSASEAYAQEPDDTTTRTLQEVTIHADMQNTTATTTTYYPTSKVKKSSSNGIDLLRRMAINSIFIDPVTNEVTTPTKEAVSVYINYLPASKGDLDGLRCADVKKVEFLDYPADPRFQGNAHVVNITVQRYVYGGYTKLSDTQETVSRFDNRAGLFSKFIYKRMTYDLYAGADVSSSSHGGMSETSDFRLSGGDVTREAAQLSHRQNQLDIPVTLRLTYDARNIQIANTVGFTFSDTRKNNSTGALMFNPDPDGMGYTYTSASPSVNRSLSWTGGYYFVFPKSTSLYLIPSFAYSHNNSASTYSTTVAGSDPIINNAVENAYTGSLNANFYKSLGIRHSLSVHLDGRFLKNKIDYSGSSPFDSDNSNTSFSGSANYTFSKDNRLVVNLSGGVGGNISEVNGDRHSLFFPFGSVSVAHSPSQKSRLQGSATYSSNAVNSFLRTVNTLQLNELLYRTGNPGLDNFPSLAVNLNYTYFPCNELTFQAFARYLGCYDRLVNTYSPYDGGTSILETTVNSGDYNRIGAGINLTGRLFSNRLVIQGQPVVTRHISSGYYRMARTHFSWNISAQYYFGDFSLTGYYGSREYNMGIITGDHVSNVSYYNLQLGWSHGNWNLSVLGGNFFRSSYAGQWSTLDTPSYSSHTTYYLPSYHSALTFSAVYTFGYGKKVNRGNEVNAQGGAESAILK